MDARVARPRWRRRRSAATATAGTSSSGTYRAALAQPAFRWVLASHAASQVGQSLFTVAITVVVWQQTRSAAWVAAAATSRLLPYVLCSAPAGVLADRYDRRALLGLAHATRLVCMVALTFAVLAQWSAPVVLMLAFGATVAGTPCYPAVAAIIPRTVPTADLAAANALFTTVESTAFVVGPAIGGGLLTLGSPAGTFAADAVVFGAALVLLRPVSLPRAAAADTVADASFVGQLVDGVRAVVGSADVAVPLLFMVVMNFVYGVSLVALLLVATDLMSVGAEGFGFLNAAVGAGAFAVVLVSNRVAASGAPLRVLIWAVLASSVPFAALALTTSLPVGLGLAFIAGAGGLLTEVVGVTILQRVLDERVLARVFGILDTTVIGAILAGSAIVPPLVDVVGLRWTLLLGGAVVPALSLAAVPHLRALSLAARTRRRAQAAPVRLLARLPLLRHAPRPVIERLAADIATEEYGAGVDVITQGDVPDDFYAVVSGRLGVYSVDNGGAELINELVPGDGFGEIGLLEGVPRTATVRTLTPVTLYRIAGHDLVATVNGAPAAAGSAPGGGLIGRSAATRNEASSTP